MIGRLLFALALLNGCSSTSVNETGSGGSSTGGASGTSGTGGSAGSAGSQSDAGACPGSVVGSYCVVLAAKNVATHTHAKAACTALGGGWELCPAGVLCSPQGLAVIANGCDCAGDASTCVCGATGNLYVHTSDSEAPYFVRAAAVPNCVGAEYCQASGNPEQLCGAALCCRP